MKAEILIDVSRLLGRAAQGRLPTGVDRVCLAYVQRWGEKAQAVVQKGGWRRIVPYKESQQLFALAQNPVPNFSWRLNQVIAKACLPPWPSQDAGAKLGLYLGHTGVESPTFQTWLKTTRQNPVYFVHDLIPISHPEYCREGEQAAHTERMTVMLKTGAGMICNSRFTLDTLTTFACSRRLPMPPAVVALLAPALLEAAFALQPELLPFPKPYFVVLGTIEPRKNHLQLLNVWRELVGRLGDDAPHLLVIGQRGWECENVVDMLERCALIKPFVYEISDCSDTDLAHFLTHAQALLFPSFVEGYGMPLVESLMLGTPVIASDLAVLKEVAGDIPDFLSAIDGIGWMQVVLDYSDAISVRRTAQLQRMRGFKVPTWDEHFTQVDGLLGRLK